jgi:radical SAM protein with 4Fe4S-binding SPASM domain
MKSTPLPTYVQMEPVGQCNLRCTMCAIPFREDGPPHGPPAFMPFATFCRLVDHFPTLEELHLQGLGEPLMHPRFFDMVDYAAAKGIRVTTNSNFTLLNASRAERCVQSGLDTVHISVDGATAEMYEKIRIRGRWHKLLRNLHLIHEARRRHESTLPHLKMVSVIMRQNLHQLPDLVRRAWEWEMESLFVQHLCHDFGESTLPAKYRPMREYNARETLLAEEEARVEHYFAAARAVAEEVGLELRLPRVRPRRHPPGTPGRERCNWPWNGAYISYDGHAMPCCMISTPDRANMGNMAQDGVAQVWNNGRYQTFRQALGSEQPPEVCRSCSVYWGTF